MKSKWKCIVGVGCEGEPPNYLSWSVFGLLLYITIRYETKGAKLYFIVRN